MAALLTGPASLLSDPDWYLHRIDPVGEQARFLPTDRARLARTLFLDGRSPFSSGPEELMPLSALTSVSSSAGPPRFIMHMSFCGSTQLAHLLDACGAALVLKEPQALVDLADWQRSLVEQHLADSRFAGALAAATALLSRHWADAPPTVIKPSNWANNLLPGLLTIPDIRLVLVMIEARPFLRAVFRGGRDRLAFTARAAAHLAAASDQSNLVEAAIAEDDDPVDRAARLTLVTHEVQRRYFTAGPDRSCERLDYGQIASEPAEALRRAAAALNLALSDDAVAETADLHSTKDAKNPGREFSRTTQDRENEVVEQHHGSRFDRALDWASRTFGRPA